MKILIVGAGIGGLTLAAFLKDSQIEFDIIEKSPDWSHQGYSISIWNNGRNILNKLGLADQFDKNSIRIRNYLIRNGKGKLLRKYNLTHFYSSYGIALNLVKRKDLHDWLIGAIGTHKVIMDCSVESIVQNDEGVIAVFTNGSSSTYDLVVGVDGIHSRVRELCFKDKVMTTSKWRVWWMWVNNKYKTEAAVTEYVEPGEFVSLFDTGEKTLAIIVGKNDGEFRDEVDGRIERLKKLFVAETAVSPGIFDGLKPEDVNPSDLIHIKLSKWSHGKVVLLGDAAHGFEPHAGIGGSMAFEDGYVLAGELMKVSNTYQLKRALENYEIKRRGRVARAYRVTSKMKAWSLIRSRSLRKLVDFIAPYYPERFIVKDYDRLMREEI